MSPAGPGGDLDALYATIHAANQEPPVAVAPPRGTEALFDWLEKAGIDRSARVLDAGCGDGRYTLALVERFGFSLDALDLAAASLEATRARAEAAGRSAQIRLLQAPLDAIPVAAGSYDLVWCRLVVCHLDDPGPALRELGRVLAEDGLLCLTFARAQPGLPGAVGLRLRSGLHLGAHSLDRDHLEEAVALAGLERVSSLDLGGEIAEARELEDGRCSQALRTLAAWSRDEAAVIAAMGRPAYEAARATHEWYLRQMLGELGYETWLLRRRAGSPTVDAARPLTGLSRTSIGPASGDLHIAGGPSYSLEQEEWSVKTDYYLETMIQHLADIVAAVGRAGAPIRDVLEIGIARGAISIGLGLLLPEARLVGVDIEPRAAELVRRNAERNGVADRLSVRIGDLCAPARGELFDLVIAELPFIPIEPRYQASLLRAGHASEILNISGGVDGRLYLDRLIREAAPLLRPGGSLVFIQPSFIGIDASLHRLTEAGLEGRVLLARPWRLADTVFTRANRGYIEQVGNYTFPRDAEGRPYFFLTLLQGIKPG